MDNQATTTQVLRTSALLVVDISGSTRLYEELGDQEAHARIDQRLRLLQRAAADHGGQVVKSMGDGLMCDFGEAERALQAAHAMQLTMFASLGVYWAVWGWKFAGSTSGAITARFSTTLETSTAIQSTSPPESSGSRKPVRSS